MGVDLIIDKITDEKDPRSLYDVAVHLCLDSISDDLVETAKKQGVVNQLGVLIDISLNYLLNETGARYSALQNISKRLYSLRCQGTIPFYNGENPEISELIFKNMPRLNSSGMNKIMNKWGVVITLDSEKFKQVYEQEYEDRQEMSRKYSSVNK